MTAPDNKQNRTESLKVFKRRHILAAARRIFDEKGIDGLNMRAIAQEAGYSLGAAYAYFGTKEEIELELMAGILGDLTRQLKSIAVSKKGTSDLALLAFNQFTTYFLKRPAERQLLLSTLSGTGTETAKIPAQVRKEFDGRLFTLMGCLANALYQNGATSPTVAQEETIEFVTYLLGLLTLENGGRLRLLNKDCQEMVDRYGQRMLLRITQ